MVRIRGICRWWMVSHRNDHEPLFIRTPHLNIPQSMLFNLIESKLWTRAADIINIPYNCYTLQHDWLMSTTNRNAHRTVTVKDETVVLVRLLLFRDERKHPLVRLVICAVGDEVKWILELDYLNMSTLSQIREGLGWRTLFLFHFLLCIPFSVAVLVTFWTQTNFSRFCLKFQRNFRQYFASFLRYFSAPPKK